MHVGQIVHGLSLIIFAVVLVQVARTVPMLSLMPYGLIRCTVTAFLMLSTAMSLSFCLVQALWIFVEPPSVLVEPIELLWLVFDWTNATAYLIFVGAIRAYLDSLSEQHT